MAAGTESPGACAEPLRKGQKKDTYYAHSSAGARRGHLGGRCWSGAHASFDTGVLDPLDSSHNRNATRGSTRLHHLGLGDGRLFLDLVSLRGKFWSREVIPTASFTWKSRAPLQCRFFAWHALRNRCWTSDRLARRGLGHQDACPFCDQEEETINHLLLDCVFTREVWTATCHALGKQDWIPSRGEKVQEWCQNKAGTGRSGKDVRAILILVLWEVWKYRNTIVFDGVTPSIIHVIDTIVGEGRTWKQAGLIKGDVASFLGVLSTWATARS